MAQSSRNRDSPSDSLQRSEALLRLLVDQITDYAIFVLDVDGTVLSWNAGAERIKGYSASEIIGQHFSVFYPADAIQRRWPEHELREATTHGRFEDEGWRIREDGSRFWANVVITALRDEGGTLRGFAKVTRDLTDRRAQQEALRRSEERFRLLVEAVIDYAIFMLDPNGYVLTWNVGARRIKGYEAKEIIGKHFSMFYPLDAIQTGWPEHELHEAAEKGRFEDEGWRIRKDGSRFWANVVITALRDESGQLQGFAKVTRDLSERRRAEALEQAGADRDALIEAERNARLQAQRAVRMKDEFLATLSHELRTPLNAILGWAQLLRRYKDIKPDDLERGTEAIERNARAQAQLIDDLLDLSRIMAGRIRLDVQRLTLSDVVQAALESIEPAALAKGIRVEKILDPFTGSISGDPARLQQVVWNLLSNAVKFTGKGGRIQIVVERVDSHVELSVSDTGIGIAPEFLPNVFDRFSQQNSSTTRGFSGLGLGLAITKQLVELHGGAVTAKSAGEGQGATFVVTLPLTIVLPDAHGVERAHPTHARAADAHALLPRLDGIRILVVDDEADARDLIERVLEEQGAIVSTAESGQAALEALESSRPQVLLSDIGMPNMDGYQLIRTIRASESPQRRVPAIALTAFARGEDRKMAMLAGYQSHVAKPFDIAELVIVVAGLIERHA
jgi:PAS domain S-box-containing protein